MSSCMSRTWSTCRTGSRILQAVVAVVAVVVVVGGEVVQVLARIDLKKEEMRS